MREEGYYYVAVNGETTIAFYSETFTCWFFPGDSDLFADEHFSKIGDKIEIPGEI